MSDLPHTIGDYAKVISGFAFKSKDFVQSGVPVVKIANIQHERVTWDKVQYLSDEFLKVPERYHVCEGDIMISLTGSHISQPNSVVGRVAKYRHSHVALLNQRAARVVIEKPDCLDRDFLYYFLRQKKVTHELAINAGGSANQANISPKDVERTTLPKIDVSIQKRISETLSAYDDLIENNRRRITLLEESARLLYREWFVHLRFPGYTTTKIIDGVPDGWRQSSIGKHSPFAYGKALRADTRNAGNVKVYGSSGVVGSHDKKLVSGPSIIIGRKGNVGSVYWEEGDFWPIDTVYFTQPENSDLFTYYAMQHVQFINTDVAVPGLNRNLAHSRELLIPSKDLLLAFKKQADKFHSQIKILGRQNEKLTEARDILLHRLMDGRIEV